MHADAGGSKRKLMVCNALRVSMPHADVVAARADSGHWVRSSLGDDHLAAATDDLVTTPPPPGVELHDVRRLPSEPPWWRVARWCPRQAGSAVCVAAGPYCAPLRRWAWHRPGHRPARREHAAPVPSALRARHDSRRGERIACRGRRRLAVRPGHRLLLHRRCPNDFCRPRAAAVVPTRRADRPGRTRARGHGSRRVARCDYAPAARHYLGRCPNSTVAQCCPLLPGSSRSY